MMKIIKMVMIRTLARTINMTIALTRMTLKMVKIMKIMMMMIMMMTMTRNLHITIIMPRRMWKLKMIIKKKKCHDIDDDDDYDKGKA